MNQTDNRSVRVAIVGDLALGGEFIARARPKGGALTFPFDPLAESFQDVDLLIVNLEGPIGTDGVARAGRASLLYNDPEVLDWLGSFPNCVCTLANNHAMDYGAEALLRTRDLLTSRGIGVVGAGENKAEADRPLRLSVNGLSIGILGFTTDEPHVGSVLASDSAPGSCALPSEAEACGRVRDLAAKTGVVVTLLHWGHEYFHYPAPEQVHFSRALAAAGATLVVGHHPHVQQGVESIGRSLICYSLGNFFLPEMRAPSGRVQYRKPVTKHFQILHARLAQGRLSDWSMEGGRCNDCYQLIPASNTGQDSGSAANPFIRLRDADYREFWVRYCRKRETSLQIQALREAGLKLWRSDKRLLVQTLSAKDMTRNLRRLGAVLRRCVGWDRGVQVEKSVRKCIRDSSKTRR